MPRGKKLTHHKERQWLYRNIGVIDDVLGTDVEFTINQDPEWVCDYIVKYLTTECTGPVSVPAKSFCVAILYAKWIEDVFGVPFIDSISSPELLLDTDQYFVEYNSTNRYIYDYVLSIVNLEELNLELYQIAKTYSYFCKEFYLHPNPYFIN